MQKGAGVGYRDMTDDELGGVALGNADAFAAMAERYYGRIYFTALALCRQREMAEDIAQETFLRVWLKRDAQAAGTVALQPWLCRIARNLAVDWLRSGQRQSRVLPLIPLEELTVEPADNARPDPRQRAQQAEQNTQLTDAVMALPDDMRQAILLHYGEGLTPSDIARLNGEAPSTVTRRLDNARRQLRAQFESGLSAGLAAMRPGGRQTQRVLATIATAAALPAASQAQLLALIANTPPPPVGGQVGNSAHAATKTSEAGMMKTLLSGTMGTKLTATVATIVVIAGGSYAVNSLTKTDGQSSKGEHITNKPTTTIVAMESPTDISSRKSGRSGKSRSLGLSNFGANGSSERLTTLEAGVTSASASELVKIQGIVYDGLTSKPLADVMVYAAAGAKDIRDLRVYPGTEKRYTAQTDSSGHYELSFPMAGERSISLDATKPGYGSVAGPLSYVTNSRPSRIPVPPSNKITEDIMLNAAPYIAGYILNENDEPVTTTEIKATIESAPGCKRIIATVSPDKNGKFEIFDFPETFSNENWCANGTNYRGQIQFLQTDYLTTAIQNLYAFSPKECSNLLIRMKSGNTIQGHLTFANGDSATSYPLYIQYGSGINLERRDIETDNSGHFVFKGLREGEAMLCSYALSLDEKINKPINIPFEEEINVHMERNGFVNTSNAVTLLGMKLINITPQLATKYNLHDEMSGDLRTSGVLVLDSSGQSDRFGIHPTEGCVIVVVANKRIYNIHGLAKQLIEAYNLPVDDAYKLWGEKYIPNVRNDHGELQLTYANHPSKCNCGVTEYVKLNADDIADLEGYLRIHGDDGN